MSSDLKGRVADQRAKAEGSGAVEKAGEAPKTIAQFIEAMKGEIARALPRHLSADRLARIALTEVRRTPKLALCSQESFGGALMTCAQLGLEPGATGEAYLIPRRNGYLSRRANRDVYEVQLTIGYQGMAKLFWQSPLAKSLDAQAVHENDEFDYAFGLEPRLFHKPALKDRGDVIAYYAVATMTSGGSGFVVLSPEDVEKFRDRSSSKDDGPWVTDYDAMSKKTCVRQVFKLLPRSPELSQAMAQDDGIRTDLSEAAIDAVPVYVTAEVVTDDEPGPVPPAAAGPDPEGGTPAPASPQAGQPEPEPVRPSDFGKLLASVPLGPIDHVHDFLSWKAGRKVTNLKELSDDDRAGMAQYITEALEAAGNDPREAASAIWADFGTESDDTGPEPGTLA